MFSKLWNLGVDIFEASLEWIDGWIDWCLFDWPPEDDYDGYLHEDVA